jgi:hypothetical protein
MIIMMIFNMSTSYFHKFSFQYFENNLMMKQNLRKYNQILKRVWLTQHTSMIEKHTS